MRVVFIAFALLCGQAHAAVFRRVQEVRYNVGKLAEPVEVLKLENLAPLITQHDWPLDPTLDFEEKALIGDNLLTAQEFVGSMNELKPMLPAMVTWLPVDSAFEVIKPGAYPITIYPSHIGREKFSDIKRFVDMFKTAGVWTVLRALDGKK